MRRQTRSELAIVSYWAIFIIAPVCFIMTRMSPSRAGLMILAMILWVIIVPQGISFWMRLWRAEEKESKSRPASRPRRYIPYDAGRSRKVRK